MKFITLLSLLIFANPVSAKNYVIFSLTQDLSMGHENEVLRKNFYVNMGAQQGVKKDSILDVFRVISVQNPYNNKERVNYRVKVGELKVLHSAEEASIAVVRKYEAGELNPIFELPQFMIGDHVAIKVD